MLDREGPEALSKWVRDAHKNVLTTHTNTVNLMCVAEETSRQLGNVFSANVWCRTTLDVHKHFLDENLWR